MRLDENISGSFNLKNEIYDNPDKADYAILSAVAITDQERDRSGTFILKDSLPVCSCSRVDGAELLPIADALKKYDWLNEKFYWHLISPESSKLLTLMSNNDHPVGFFLRVKKGRKVVVPFQAALYMSGSIGRQELHNIVILEDDSELELITGCVSNPGLKAGEHIAVSETYIGRNARLTNTMIHSWNRNIQVMPFSATRVEEGGSYLSNYVSLKAAGMIESNPVTYLDGAGASAKYFSVILGSEDSSVTMGGDVYLNADGTSAEIAHRAVCTGGKIIQKGLLVGRARCHAHVDCSGMIVNPGCDGYIKSVPGLRSHHEEASMSHEASIGKIAPRQVQYLMAHGMEEREAISMIVRGFLDADIKGLGPELDRRIMEIAELAGHGEEV